MIRAIFPFEGGRVADLRQVKDGTFGATIDRDGRVTAVAPGSAGALAGLAPGDLVIAINERAISRSEDISAALAAIPAGEAFALTVRRGGVDRAYRLTRRVLAPGSSTLYSIGHPRGSPWTWNAGHLLVREGNDRMLVSKDLTPAGASGGPLFDEKYRVVGIVVERAEDFGYGVDIARVLAFVEQWRVPYRFWRSADFCAKLREVVSHIRADFKDLRIGAGQADRRSSGTWRWDAKVDLSGYRKSYIVRERGEWGDYHFESEMSDWALGIEEADNLRREVATEVFKCFPDPDVEKGERSIRVIFRDGPSMFDPVRSVSVWVFGSSVVVRIGSR